MSSVYLMLVKLWRLRHDISRQNMADLPHVVTVWDPALGTIRLFACVLCPNMSYLKSVLTSPRGAFACGADGRQKFGASVIDAFY
jgi:hypothetical protein